MAKESGAMKTQKRDAAFSLFKSAEAFAPGSDPARAVEGINRVAPDAYRAYNSQVIGTGSSVLDEVIDVTRGGANAKKMGNEIVRQMLVRLASS